MMKLALLAAVLASCVPDESKFTWEGIGSNRVCSFSIHATYRNETDGGGTCLSNGHVYACVTDSDALKVVCARLMTDINCTNITNVETVCPGVAK